VIGDGVSGGAGKGAPTAAMARCSPTPPNDDSVVPDPCDGRDVAAATPEVEFPRGKSSALSCRGKEPSVDEAR